MEALRRSKEELQELGAAAHMTREQEKSRIARELHDELGQLLTMLQMDVAWCKDRSAGRRRGVRGQARPDGDAAEEHDRRDAPHRRPTCGR